MKLKLPCAMPETFEHNNKIQKYYSLGELAGSIRKVITRTYTGAYWVKAEITKLNFYPYSGHCYPDLVEKQNQKVIAQIRATIWSGTYDLISKKFIQVTGEKLKEGITVLFLVKVVYHEQHGLSLNILDIEPSFTLGEMAREKQLSIQRLRREQLLDRNKKLEFPLLPKRIAVLSVETSKGYHDFVNILLKNRYGYHFEHTLFPVLLQGDGAVRSMVQQLKNIAAKTDMFDVAVIIRGGGGDVGLSAYDTYRLAREVALFPLPVITGIGHSTNETVTEMIAYANKITPTDVAYFLIEKFENFHAEVADLSLRLESAIQNRLQLQEDRLNDLWTDFNNRVILLVEQNKNQLQLYGERLQNQAKRFLYLQQNRINELKSGLGYKPEAFVLLEKDKLNRLTGMLESVSKRHIKNSVLKLEHINTKLDLLKPENILKRGYSITLLNGKPLTSADKLKPGNRITTQLYRDTVESEVTSIK